VADPVIVVAHESETIREAIRLLCAKAGYHVSAVPDGYAAMSALELRPTALVLDVALPKVHAYQVVEESKRLSPDTRVVLVASIYNRTGYKRRPTSLYGADDYVEQHHIPDSLLGKLERLIGPAPRPTASPPPHAQTKEGREIRAAGEERLAALPDASSQKLIERAERLARLIVTDIALYNGDAVAHEGDDAELEARLRIDMEEGRLLFDLRVPKDVRRTRDFIGEALAEIRGAKK
jgi:CheY-like chemotaxis protein